MISTTDLLIISTVIGVLTLIAAGIAAYWSRRGAKAQERAILPEIGKDLKLKFAATKTIGHTVGSGDELPLLLQYTGGTSVGNLKVSLTAMPELLTATDEWTHSPEPSYDATLRGWHTWELKKPLSLEPGDTVTIPGLKIKDMPDSAKLRYYILIGKHVLKPGDKPEDALWLGTKETDLASKD